MEISQGGVQANLAAQQQLWSLVKARRQSQQERAEGQAFVEERLGSLLLGQELNASQQADYVRRLAGTAARAQQFGQALEVGDLEAARIPRDRLLCRVSGVAWRPFPISRRQVTVTPLHRRQQDRMALALKTRMALSPQSERRCVVAIGFSAERGGVALPIKGEDRVELSGWSLESLELEQKIKEAPALPAPHFLFATVAPGAGGAIAASTR